MAAVARLAGVSQGAVSSMLNDRDYGIRVSARTREKVFRICREIGYVPNDLRALVRIFPEQGETCLLVPEKTPGGVADPFVARLAAALLAHAVRKPSSMSVMLYDETRDYALEELPGPLKHGTASQMLCTGAGNDAIRRIAQFRGVPMLVVGHSACPPGVTCVAPDYLGAARLALDAFIRHGHTRVGVVSGPFGSHDPRLSEMSVAIGDAAAQLGIAIDPKDVISGNLGFEAGFAALRQIREGANAPTALLCLSEKAAAGVLAAAQVLGLRVPAHVSVIAFADHAGVTDSCIPLSTVAIPADGLAAAAVKEVERQFREGIPTESAKITIDVRLIERDTCGPAPAC